MPPLSSRVLWIGDNPTLPSLSAEAGRKTCRQLASAGLEVFYYGLHRTQAPILWEGVTLMPAFVFTGDASAASGRGGATGLEYALRVVHPDAVVTCGALDAFEDLRYLRSIEDSPVPWHHWPAPDGDPGESTLHRAGGFELQAFAFPVEPVFRLLEDRSAPRARIGAATDFVVGSLARNLPRRGIARVLRQLDELATELSELKLLWVEDVHRREVESFKVEAARLEHLRHHRAYWTDTAEDASILVFDLLNAHFNAMDVFLSFAPPGAVDLAALEAACTGADVVRLSDPDWVDRLRELYRLRQAPTRATKAAEAATLHHVGPATRGWIDLLQAAAPPVSPSRPAGPRINWYCTVFGSGSVNHGSRELILALDRAGADLTIEEPFPRFENPVLFPDAFEENYAEHNPLQYARLKELLSRRPHDLPYTTVRFIVSRAETSQYQLMRSLKAPVVEYSNNDNPGRLGPDFVRGFFEGRRYWVCSEYIRSIHGAAASFPAGEIPRIDVVYHGADPEVYHPGVEPVDLGTQDRFVFLTCSFPRVQHKGLDLLCEAYATEFRGDPEVVLVLKLPDPDLVVAPNEYDDVEAVLTRVRALPGCPEIRVVTADTPGRGDLARYYASGDAYVHPSRWEAGSIAIFEAAAVGAPLILTRWGGHREFIPEDLAYYVDCQPALVDYGRSAEPDLASLRRQMRYVYEHSEEAYERGLAASNHVRENYTWDHAARRILELLEAPGDQATTFASMAERLSR